MKVAAPIFAALILMSAPANAFQNELAEAHRCHVDKASRYAKICDSISSLSSAVLGACDAEYRATISAFASSPRASALTDSDKLELGKKLFDGAKDRIAYFIAEERLIQSVCLD